eukprot:c47206_g1_i1 orf=545-2827(+)
MEGSLIKVYITMCTILCFLRPSSAAANTSFTQGDLISQEKKWTCVCDPGGVLGSQISGMGTNFTECSCPSDCPLCPTGQIVDPTIGNNDNCSCVRTLMVVVRLLKLDLAVYTINMEKNFTNSLASILQVSSTQVIPVSRRDGSVILDIYIFPTPGAVEHGDDLDTIAATLLERNKSHGGVLEDSQLGPFTIVAVDSPPSVESLYTPNPSRAKSFEGNFLLPALILSATIVAVALLACFVCLIYHRRKHLSQSSIFWFEKDSSSNGFRTLISHQSSVMEDFQVYDNACFSGTTGCMGRRSHKINRMGPLLGSIIRQFSYADLYDATEGFSKQNVVGLGGSSRVFRGYLKDGRAVAIKKLTHRPGADADHEFLLEVELLSRLHHFHLVPLLGYCIETQGRDVERLLVYQYMPNGNLREHLNRTMGNDSLGWVARVKIALGAARGLEYLHEAADPRVLHRDFKSSNILLDAKWRAKVADFGMATIFKDTDCNNYCSSPDQMLGTFGYFAPEYAMMGRATVKSDVFSFGVVLLELITGRQPVDKSLPPGRESLVFWAFPLLQDKKAVRELVDPAMNDDFPVDDMFKMTQLACACLQTDPEARPTMTLVMQILATMVPQNTKTNDLAELTATGYQAFQLLSYPPDCSFSREESSQNDRNMLLDSSVINSTIVDDNKKVADQKLSDRQLLLFEIEEEAANHKGLSVLSMRSTSWSAAECLQKLTAMTGNDPIRRSPDEEALDLVKPRLETFWQNNSLVAQISSPAR